MNDFFGRLFANIPGGIDQSTQEVPSLVLDGVGQVAIQGDTLFVTTGNVAQTIDLHASTVSKVASQMPSGITTTVLQNGMAELLLLPSTNGYVNLPVTLSIAQNPLWFLIGTEARMLESRRRSLNAQVAQLDERAATSRILDWWGATLGVERYTGEPDSLYAQRISEFKFQPNVNNIAIENVLATMGYTSTVTDTQPANFTVDITLPRSPPNGFYYTTSQLQDAVGILKAAGTIATIVLQSAIQDTIVVSDSVTTTISDPTTYQWGGYTASLLSPYIMTGGWTWGTGEWLGSQV